MATNSIKKKINITIYFENLSVELYVLYVVNTYFKFVHWMLFTIQFINLFFIYNFKLQELEI